MRLPLYCNRPKGAHRLGHVDADDDGNAVIVFRESVHGAAGITWQDGECRLDAAESRAAYCSSCEREFPLTTTAIRAALADGRKALTLEPLGMHIDPVGVLDRRQRPAQR